jgi:hypothetical protein
MAFGKQSGPPASHQQLQELQDLLEAEGYDDFRDARGPMGFTQRQAGGKFTRDDAQQFIDQLEEAEDQRRGNPVEEPVAAEPPAPPEPDSLLRDVPSEQLAAELRRRGWKVSEG